MPEFPVGALIGDYRLVAFLGKGGMGEVHEARRADRAVRYAIKILKAGSGASEGSILERIDHPNVVVEYDSGTFVDSRGDTRHYIVMRLIRQACSISEFASRRHLDAAQRVRLFLGACEGVEAMHAIGTHLDLKPENILVDEDGHVYVNDFGLARLATDLSPARSGLSVAFASPEQVDSPVADLDHRSDVWSLGATLYDLLTGRPPHFFSDALDASEIRRAKRRTPPPAAALCPSADADLERIIRRAMAYDRHDRYRSVAQFREALEAWLATRGNLGVRIRRMFSRHPACRAMISAAAVAFFGAFLAGLALVPWVHRAVAWERFVPAVGTPESFEHVVLVPLPPPAEVEALAVGRGLEGVGAKDPPTWRYLHAQLCDRLAGVADTIAFDIAFEGPHEADAALAAAIVAAAKRETAIVLASRTRIIDAEEKPEISGALWQATRHWGYFTLFPTTAGVWVIPLLTEHEGQVMPSLALATAAATRVRNAYPQFSLDRDANAIDARFWSPGLGPGGRRWANRTDRSLPSAIASYEEMRVESNDRGFVPGDVYACQFVGVPSAAAREAATIDYATLLTDDEALARVDGRVALVYDASRDEPVESPDGQASGVHLHAVAIETLLAGRTVRYWGGPEHILPMVLMGLLGALLGWATVAAAIAMPLPVRRDWTLPAAYHVAAFVRWTLEAAVILGLHAAAVRFCESTWILFSPVPAACALVVAGEIGALVALCVYLAASPKEQP